MKRFLGIALSVVMLTGMLCGCSKNNNASKPGTTTSSSGESKENITLTVWESTGGPDKFIEQAGERYTKLHPDVTVKFVNVELDNTSSQIALDGPAGVGPDLFVSPHDKIGELVEGGHIEETRNADKIKAAVLPVCADAITYKGKMYGYPVAAETYALFYNKKLVNEVPKTFEEVESFCRNYNSGDRYGLMFDVANGYYTVIFTTNDGNRPFDGFEKDPTDSKINNASAVKGMEYFQSLRKSILNVPSSDLTTAVADEAFKSGKAAMHITGPWNVASFRDAGLDFGVAPLPCLPGEDTPPASFSGVRTMFVSAYSKHPDEAADFAQFLVSEDMQRLRYELTEAIPSIPLDIDDDHLSGFLEQLDHAFAMPSIPQMSKFWDAMNSASANVWDGADVKKELDACNKAIVSN